MSDGSRIPRTIDLFNSYIINSTTYLLSGTPVTNASRLGINEDETTQWSGIHDQWVPLYAKYSDKKNSRTTAIRDQMLYLIEQIINFDQSSHILDRIASSLNVTIADMETFNIKKGILQKATRSFSSTPISELVTVTIQPIGGGTVSIKCYSTTGQRPAIYAGADCVQYLFTTGDTPPVSADAAGLNKDVSSKGAFILALGAGTPGKTLYIYFRWYNTRHPELAGPWSSLQTSLIL